MAAHTLNRPRSDGDARKALPAGGTQGLLQSGHVGVEPPHFLLSRWLEIQWYLIFNCSSVLMTGGILLEPCSSVFRAFGGPPLTVTGGIQLEPCISAFRTSRGPPLTLPRSLLLQQDSSAFRTSRGPPLTLPRSLLLQQDSSAFRTSRGPPLMLPRSLLLQQDSSALRTSRGPPLTLTGSISEPSCHPLLSSRCCARAAKRSSRCSGVSAALRALSPLSSWAKPFFSRTITISGWVRWSN